MHSSALRLPQQDDQCPQPGGLCTIIDLQEVWFGGLSLIGHLPEVGQTGQGRTPGKVGHKQEKLSGERAASAWDKPEEIGFSSRLGTGPRKPVKALFLKIQEAPSRFFFSTMSRGATSADLIPGQMLEHQKACQSMNVQCRVLNQEVFF